MKQISIPCAVLLIFIFSLTAASGQGAGFPVFDAEFWFFNDHEPLFPGPERKNREEENEENIKKLKNLLEEASYAFSGMIYGFNFSYTPSDRSRGVDEIFEFTPAAVIRGGDSALTVKKTRMDKTRTYVSIEYRCDERHENWLSYWMSSVFPVTGGSGKGIPDASPDARKKAVSDAVKEAVRDYMRGRVHNKPRSISGSCVFSEPPVISHMAGLYTASVKIRLDVKDVEKYTVF
ncbi:MAG: hypothetical protein RBT69_01110 [Spirochaetia bacterium]|jgi:hypothetical protein|nr:hypothetical protein [Spirochaetia bacterium]